MSRSDWRARIADILESITNVRSFIADMTYDQFAGDTKTIRAAAYEVIVIGEAAANVPDEVRARFPDIPWHKMQGIRNVVVHQYFRVDLQILWKTIAEDLPALVPALRKAVE